jgi:hypothetical protein
MLPPLHRSRCTVGHATIWTTAHVPTSAPTQHVRFGRGLDLKAVEMARSHGVRVQPVSSVQGVSTSKPSSWHGHWDREIARVTRIDVSTSKPSSWPGNGPQQWRVSTCALGYTVTYMKTLWLSLDIKAVELAREQGRTPMSLTCTSVCLDIKAVELARERTSELALNFQRPEGHLARGVVLEVESDSSTSGCSVEGLLFSLSIHHIYLSCESCSDFGEGRNHSAGGELQKPLPRKTLARSR